MNHIPNKVWDEIIYPSPNFNGCSVEVWELVINFFPHFTDYLSMLTFKLIHVDKRGSRCLSEWVPWIENNDMITLGLVKQICRPR